jgi:hypothetical protein
VVVGLMLAVACGRGSETAQDSSDGPTLRGTPVTPSATGEVYGEKPEVVSPEARATVETMSLIGSAIESFEDDNDYYPNATRLEDLKEALVPGYLSAIPLTDGWGRPFELSRVDGNLELRSLGADGVRDEGAARGAVSDPGADIVYWDEGFAQWPASVPAP